MKKLLVNIEISGKSVFVGTILGNDSADARFTYASSYLENPSSSPISISLPLQPESFSPVQTRNYFEGLLPEGFLKMTIAQRMRTDESDYLSILSGLGRECLGAVTICSEGDEEVEPSYERLTMDQIRELAREGATKSVQLVTQAHLSLAGASGKVGLYYDSDNLSWYVPLGNAPSTHIIKQSHIRLDAIVMNEQLSLLTAGLLGITIPESHIINTGSGGEGEVLFATKRYDRIISPEESRVINGLPVPRRLHQEDFAQALGIASINKYEQPGEQHMKAMFDTVRRHSANPIEDQLRLWDIIVFDYLVGNTDNHIKNLSLVYSADLRTVRLAPAYDIISTVTYASGTRDMAFSVNGKYSIDKIGRDDFAAAAKACGLGTKIAMARFDRLADGFCGALREAAEKLSGQGFEKAGQYRDRILEAGGIRNLQ